MRVSVAAGLVMALVGWAAAPASAEDIIRRAAGKTAGADPLRDTLAKF